jgi:hypothetical protein
MCKANNPCVPERFASNYAASHLSWHFGTGCQHHAHITTGEEEKMMKMIMINAIILSMCLAAYSLALNARAQDDRQYTDGPVT